MIDFTSYKPHRIFLVQGTESLYQSIVADAKEDSTVVHALSTPRFTVDHAGACAAFAIEGDGTERMLIVYFTVFSPDAAQVLLKSLEEPDELTTIIFVTPYPYVVPITIRSRVALLQTTRAVSTPRVLTREEAYAYVKKELASDSDDDAATRRSSAIAFLDDLELLQKGDPQKSKVIYEAKHMLFRANLPTKFVIEYVITAVL